MAKGILNVGGGVVSVDASGNFTVETGLIADGASVFNETGVDVDFRIESDDNANMFFVDGGNDRVGIGIATPASALDVRGTVQVGVDGTGHDVIFYGDTASSNMTWDQNGNTDGQLVLNDARLFIDQDDNVTSIEIDSEATSAHCLNINAAVTTGRALYIEANSLTTGDLMKLYMNGASTGSRSLLNLVQDNSSASGTTVLRVQQDSVGDIVNFFDGATEVFTILDGGNVGINNGAPASALHVTGTVQVGVDGTGYDVKFFGDTASAYMLWDEDVDDLVLAGVAGINVSGTGTITGTLATAAQSNITSLGTLTGLTVNGAAVFNENSADVDFRIESNGDANMFFVDGGTDKVGIGTNAVAAGQGTLTVYGRMQVTRGSGFQTLTTSSWVMGG